MIKSVRGTRDLLPPETALWNHVESVVRDVFRAYNFHEIRTPIFEETQLFVRSVGEETDVVSKEMYSWEDGGGSADDTILQGWMINHKHDFTGFGWVAEGAAEFQRSRFGPALQGTLNGRFTIVRARYGITATDIRQMAELRERWKALGKSDVRVVLATWPAVAQHLQFTASQRTVELEEVPLPDVEPPKLLTLRPENTAGTVRAYIEHKLWERGLNKLYYIGPQFRRERPQKGRYRQFYQIGAEAIGPPSAGSESPARDAEIIELLATLLDRLGIKNWTLQLNSIGCANDRAAYNEALRQALAPVKDKMCTDCQRRAVTNPLRVFDCKVPEDQPIIETLPRISQYLDEPCRQHFTEVKEILKAVGVDFVENDRLVRGLDYYMRTTFEFTHGALGAQNAILGGGRYDGLSESLGGPQAPGIGFAIGEDRLVLALQESAEAVQPKPDVYIAPLGSGMDREAARLARELRRENLAVELGDEKFRLKKSLETASKMQARCALIVGENEVKSGEFALKNLSTGQQSAVPRADLAKRIQSLS